VPDPQEAERTAARIDQARQAVAAAEQRVAQAAGAASRVTALQAQLDRSSAEEQAAAQQQAAAEAELARVTSSPELDAAGAVVTTASQALAQAQDVEQAASSRLAAAGDPAAPADLAPMLLAHEAQLQAATADHAAAMANVAGVEAEFAAAEQRVADALLAHDAAESAMRAMPATGEDLVEEIEWYLLARLAEQRAVSFAGSVPLVLDDPFLGLDGDAPVRLVSRLERMAAAVQVIVLSDDPNLATWAGGLGPDRALVVDFALA
jgi:exonuclease SbcC